MRQPLRAWGYEAEAKQGTHRQALAVAPCFVPLLRWVRRHWQGTPLALALEATLLGTRCAGLAISVRYPGGALPVAWTILPANTPRAWRPHGLRRLRPTIPRHWTVLVLAERGLYAGWWFRRIVRLGWPPV